MITIKWLLPDLEATAAAGAKLSKTLEPGCIVMMEGDLGSGKTTLCKNICASLGVPINLVTSPTYTMVNMYSYDSGVIHHLDLYRLEDQKELEDFDFEDLIAVDGITLVEWPKLLRPLIDTQRVLNININYVSDGSRELILSSHDCLYERLMN
ncbi:MAG: tRNA (adenosine(37)-N6)-threonylcarbamoyltransferase complex ATPase subunit type 1 TsaE [bacterium]|jgi:tRNA threonylcarbamoyladenosine biosynthesis protein TsaE